jgi:uncharacterized protein YyaL (SSP411 family)
MANHLVNESSPYLLQHAHNPVDWYPWNDEAWEKAKKEDKLVLVSIGYSSCHWCHVMEHESFENEATAKLMNEYFICIKVDREERPDVDQVYMAAVQLLTGSGGWPLNCFCLPNGKPLYGGTYYPNATWNDVLVKLNTFYKENKEKANQYGEELTQGINQMESFHLNTAEQKFHLDDVKKIVDNWRKYFDLVEGGPNRAPKFPMPNNYEFLLHYNYVTKDESILNYVLLTLDKMAFGGIYDQIGGGFARYSTDALWKAPHFEKMLYDNAQLVSLYSHAYQLTKKELYKEVVYQTLEWIEREMTNKVGGFYSALDADSEGVEGKYYVWKKDELEALLGERFRIFAEYYNVNETGHWEHDNYILLRKESDEHIAQKNNLSVHQLNQIINNSNKVLLAEREKRIRPGLDDKQLTSWNALMIKAYSDASVAFDDEELHYAAGKGVHVILTKLLEENGRLFHSYKNGRASIDGFLEDYAFTIEALISYYQAVPDDLYLDIAKKIADYTIEHFYDKESGMFWFTSDTSPELISRKKEIVDNVIPSSNSSMAKSLFYLGKYYGENRYIEIATQMLANVKDAMATYGSSYSNWAMLMLHLTAPFYEIVITGPQADDRRVELQLHYLPNSIITADAEGTSRLPILLERYVEGKILIYVCENNTCKLPVETVGEALKSLL